MTRIARVEVIPYALPFRSPYVTARGRLDRRELVLLLCHGDDGTVGAGETASLSLRGGAPAAEIAAELEECCVGLLVGAEAGVEEIAPLLEGCRAAGVSLEALAAIDIALWDLAGKVEGRPIWALLGAERAEAVSCNATLVAGEPNDVAADAAAWAERGFETFKLKVGVERDIEQVAAVREAVGPAGRIRVDANGTWSVEEAVEKLRAMNEHGVELAEQPVVTLDELAALGGHSGLPRIAADESVVNVEDARRAVGLGSCELATVKLAKVGGIQAALAISAEIPVYLSSALEGPVGIAAALHTTHALPRSRPAAGLAHGLATLDLFSETIASAGWPASGPTATPPAAPGHGVEVDLDALAAVKL